MRSVLLLTVCVVGCGNPIETPPVQPVTHQVQPAPRPAPDPELVKRITQLEEEVKGLRTQNVAQSKSLAQLQEALRKRTAPVEAKQPKYELRDHDVAMMRFMSLPFNEQMNLLQGQNPGHAIQFAAPRMRNRFMLEVRAKVARYGENFGWNEEEESSERDNALCALAEMNAADIVRLQMGLALVDGVNTAGTVRAMQFASPKVRARVLAQWHQGSTGQQFDSAFGWETPEKATARADAQERARLEAEEAGRRSYRESKWAAAKGAIEKREEIEKRKEADLQGKLRLAKRFLDTDPAVAKRRLQELVKQYPDTDEAKEATKLLRKLEEDAK